MSKNDVKESMTFAHSIMCFNLGVHIQEKHPKTIAISNMICCADHEYNNLTIFKMI